MKNKTLSIFLLYMAALFFAKANPSAALTNVPKNVGPFSIVSASFLCNGPKMKVQLVWGNSENATSYDIRQEIRNPKSGSTFSYFTNVHAAKSGINNTFTVEIMDDNALCNNTSSFVYTLTAFNSTHTSSLSSANSKSVIPQPCVDASKTFNIIITNNCLKVNTLSIPSIAWGDITNACSYRILRDGVAKKTISSDAINLWADADNTRTAKNYIYQVIANAHNKRLSVEKTYKPHKCLAVSNNAISQENILTNQPQNNSRVAVPSNPGNFSMISVVSGNCTPDGHPTFTIHWSAATNATYYDVFEDGRATSNIVKKNISDVKCTIVLKDTKAGPTSHTYYVRAKTLPGKEFAESWSSNLAGGYASITKTIDYCFLITGADKACKGINPTMNISWEKVDKATGYEIYEEGKSIGKTTTTNFLYTMTPLVEAYNCAGRTSYYQVFATRTQMPRLSSVTASFTSKHCHKIKKAPLLSNAGTSCLKGNGCITLKFPDVLNSCSHNITTTAYDYLTPLRSFEKYWTDSDDIVYIVACLNNSTRPDKPNTPQKYTFYWNGTQEDGTKPYKSNVISTSIPFCNNTRLTTDEPSENEDKLIRLYPAEMVLAVPDIEKNIEVDEILPASVTLFPNPTTGEFSLNMEGLTTNNPINVTLFDLSGKNVFTSQLMPQNESNAKINIAHLPAGIYLVNIAVEGKEYHQKIIKE